VVTERHRDTLYAGSTDYCFGLLFLRHPDAESIRISFDSSRISYRELLDLFFEMHTPADPRWAGTQYRSAIFVHTPEQREQAEQAVAIRGRLGMFVAVEDASDFYAAEEYHQKYIEKMTGMRSSINASDESFWV
jgi:peptide methionine sulfoxide reductase MsrA